MDLEFVWMFASGGHIEKSHVSEHFKAFSWIFGWNVFITVYNS